MRLARAKNRLSVWIFGAGEAAGKDSTATNLDAVYCHWISREANYLGGEDILRNDGVPHNRRVLPSQHQIGKDDGQWQAFIREQTQSRLGFPDELDMGDHQKGFS